MYLINNLCDILIVTKSGDEFRFNLSFVQIDVRGTKSILAMVKMLSFTFFYIIRQK